MQENFFLLFTCVVNRVCLLKGAWTDPTPVSCWELRFLILPVFDFINHTLWKLKVKDLFQRSHSRATQQRQRSAVTVENEAPSTQRHSGKTPPVSSLTTTACRCTNTHRHTWGKHTSSLLLTQAFFPHSLAYLFQAAIHHGLVSWADRQPLPVPCHSYVVTSHLRSTKVFVSPLSPCESNVWILRRPCCVFPSACLPH